MKTLIVVDVQNDFITGALKNTDAEAIVPAIAEKIKNWDGAIILTRDTHFNGTYEKSLEGQYLPADKGLKHCIFSTDGWKIHQEVWNAVKNNIYMSQGMVINKSTFGYTKWDNKSDDRFRQYIKEAEEIEICGFCTEICVMANAVILRAMYPNKIITIDSKLTEGVTKDAKEAALKVLAAQEIVIK